MKSNISNVYAKCLCKKLCYINARLPDDLENGEVVRDGCQVVIPKH
jgi:hypothetical protein